MVTYIYTTSQISDYTKKTSNLVLKINTLGADITSEGKVFQSLMILCEKLCPLTVVLKRFL